VDRNGQLDIAEFIRSLRRDTLLVPKLGRFETMVFSRR
jgi:hypothetical protein